MVIKKSDPDPVENDTYDPYVSPRVERSYESPATGWFVGTVVALALLAIGYLVFSANSGQTEVTAPPAASSDSAVGVKQ